MTKNEAEQHKVLGPEATVELVRAMRAVGHSPEPSYVAELVETVGEICADMELDPGSRYEFEIFSPPLSIAFALTLDDFHPVIEDETSQEAQKRRQDTRAIFAMLDHDAEIPTIADKGRIQIRVVSPREINAEGLDIWNGFVEEIDAGEWVPHDLTPKLRNYVLDVKDQVGYRIASSRTVSFSKAEFAVPALAGKKVMVIDFVLLTIDGGPVAVSADATARSFWLDAHGLADSNDYEQLQERTLRRALSGKHVSFATDKLDQIRNADLLAANMRFNANDYPLFFDDVVFFEVLGKKVDRCKPSLPRRRW